MVTKKYRLTGIVALTSLTGCVPLVQYQQPKTTSDGPCHLDPSGEYSAICESDSDHDGIPEQRFYDSSNRLVKELEGDVRTEFTYSSLGNLERYLIYEKGKTSIHEFEKDRIKRDLYDADSDGHFEDIFEYDKDGAVTRYLADQNDDGFPDTISCSSHEERSIRIKIDVDFNLRFDTFMEYVLDNKGKIVEEWKKIDKSPEDGKIDLIYGTFYDGEGNVVKITSDYDGDGVPEDVWYPG